MSNSNDNNEISSNVSCNPGPSSSVDSSINNRTTNPENNDTYKASTKSCINKIISIERTCENQSSSVVNQANIVNVVSPETNPSSNQNAGASSSNSFSPGTLSSEIIEDLINFSTANSKDDNNKNILIPEAKHFFKSQTNINKSNITEESGNVNPELLFQPSQTNHLNLDSRLAEGNIFQVNQTVASFPQQSTENQALIGSTPNLTLHQNDTDDDDKNAIINQPSINENCNNSLENGANTIDIITDGTANVSAPNTRESTEAVSEFQVTTSIYLTNNPSGLPCQSSLEEHRNTQHSHRQERVRHTVASFSQQLPYSPRASTADCSTSIGNAPNLTQHYNVVPALITEICDTISNCQAESNIEVNITPPPVPPRVIQGPPPIAGAPPTYSAIMRLGPDDRCHQWTHSIRIQPSAPFIAPIPPPPYTEIQGMHTDRPMVVASAEQMVWGPDPMSIVCPRCANVVVTSTQSQRSNLTHFSALALCLCGCWPCCLLPYCTDSCKNTYHHCPTCQQFLGMYRPW